MERVVVVGGGFAGLATAACLAAARRQVLVVEKAAQPGGALARIALGQHYFDMGQPWLLLPHLIADLFAAAEQRLEDHLDFLRIDPIARYRFADGATFDWWSDPARLREEVARIAPDDVDALGGFFSYSKKVLRAWSAGPWRAPNSSVSKIARSLLAPPALIRLPWLFSLRRASGTAKRFKSPYLRTAFAWAATETGASPYYSPAASLWPAQAAMEFGLWYPRGGMAGLLRAMLRILDSLGVEIRCGASVREILIEGGRARGVVTESGERISASAVVCATAPLRLLPLTAPTAQDKKVCAIAKLHRRWAKMRRGPSRYVLLLACAADWESLAHRTVFFGGDPALEWLHLREWNLPAPEPAITVAHPARTDPSLAPEGHTALSISTIAPPLSPRWRWTEEARAALRAQILRRLQMAGLRGIQASILEERELAPPDWAEFTGDPQGSWFGPAADSMRGMLFRPSCRHPLVGGLYFTGRWAHPGPLPHQAALGARATARLVLEDGG